MCKNDNDGSLPHYGGDSEEKAKEIFEATTTSYPSWAFIEDHYESESKTITLISQVEFVEDKDDEFASIHLGTDKFKWEIYDDLGQKVLDTETRVRVREHEMGLRKD